MRSKILHLIIHLPTHRNKEKPNSKRKETQTVQHSLEQKSAVRETGREREPGDTQQTRRKVLGGTERKKGVVLKGKKKPKAKNQRKQKTTKYAKRGDHTQVPNQEK